MDLAHAGSASPLNIALVIFWLALAPALALLYVLVPTSPDQALFDYIAWMKIHGAPYYKGVAEQNWPGEMLIHELGVRLFGVHFWTYRLVDFFLMQISAIGIFVFLRRAGFILAPFIALAAYPVIYTSSGYWAAGQRDVVAAEFLILASTLLIGSSQAPTRLLQAGLAGILIAFAVITRPTYAPFLVGVLLLGLLGCFQERESRFLGVGQAASVLAGFIALIAVMVIAGWLTESLGDWYEQAVLFNLQAYPAGRSRLELVRAMFADIISLWHWLAAFGTLGLVTWIWQRGLRSESTLIAGTVLTILVSYFVQGKGFGYHLSGLIPVFILLTAIGIDELRSMYLGAPTSRRRWVFGAAVFFVAAVTAAGTLKRLTAFSPQIGTLVRGEFQPTANQPTVLNAEEAQTLVKLIQAGSSANEHFLQWGRNFEIGYLAQRPSSTRFVSTPALDILSDRFVRADAWLVEFRKDLNAKPPAFILVDRASLGTLESPLSAPAEASAALRILIDKINAGYRIVLATTKVVLFERRQS